MSSVFVGSVEVGGGAPLALIAGPCVIEQPGRLLSEAEEILKVCQKSGIPLIFKASFDKANRTSLTSFRGPGIDSGLEALALVKSQLGIPVTTDIHLPEHAALCAEVVDLIQIPAFLCRQTDLLVAAAKTGRPVNIKKAQFLAPRDMEHAVNKVRSHSNAGIILTERGTSFGYNNLVVDFRAFSEMAKFNTPICFDATHSTQLPGGHGGSSGGQREQIVPLASAAVAAGANLIFAEVHPNPEKALSDAATQLPIGDLYTLLTRLSSISRAVVP